MKATDFFTLTDLPVVFSALKKEKHFYNLSKPEVRCKYLECGFRGYLLSTEIITFLHYLPNLHQQTLIYTLWCTGSDINEIKKLTRKSFVLKKPYSYIKFQDKSGNLNSKNNHSHVSAKLLFYERIIPLLNKHHIMQLRKLFFSQKLIGSSKTNPYIWDIDIKTATNWLNDALLLARKDGVKFPVDINLDIIKRSYSVYLLTQGVPPVIIQKLLLSKENANSDNKCNIRS